jgi:hypothetical protein
MRHVVVAAFAVAFASTACPAENKADEPSWELQQALFKVAPKTWQVFPPRNGQVFPTNLAKSDGIEIRMQRVGYVAEDWKRGLDGEAYVWLMPVDYEPRPAPHDAQTGSAREIEVFAEAMGFRCVRV